MNYSQILQSKMKDWSCPDLMTSVNHSSGPKIPFSSPLLNYASYGGIPRNKISEFFGEPGSGKSTSCVDICKNAFELFQKEHNEEIAKLSEQASSGNKSASIQLEDLIERGPKKILYIDVEHAFDKAWSTKLGIKPDEIDIMQPPDIPAEEILNTIIDVVSSNELGLVVLDSIPSLVPKSELDKKIGERTVASLAGPLTVFLRKIVPLLTRYNTTLILINQIRDNMDNPYQVKTPGGNAVKFYSSFRVSFRLGHPIDFLGNELPMSTDSPAGYIVQSKLVKQKTAPFDRKSASYYLLCTEGIMPMFDYAQLAIKQYGLIKKSGAWFTLIDPDTGEILDDEAGRPVKLNGQAKVYQYLQDNEGYYNKLKEYILADINGVPKEESIEEDITDEPTNQVFFN